VTTSTDSKIKNGGDGEAGNPVDDHEGERGDSRIDNCIVDRGSSGAGNVVVLRPVREAGSVAAAAEVAVGRVRYASRSLRAGGEHGDRLPPPSDRLPRLATLARGRVRRPGRRLGRGYRLAPTPARRGHVACDGESGLGGGDVAV